jgi:CheY-like chemotaxis protein
MSSTRSEPGFSDGTVPTDRQAPHGLAPDLSRVLVVGNSPINRIVVAKIVERSGLRPVCEPPASALRVLPLTFPAMVILDGGPDNGDCDGLVAGIAALRSLSGGKLPAVILLSNRTGPALSPTLLQNIDELVPKPFTTEQLLPVVQKLLRNVGR